MRVDEALDGADAVRLFAEEVGPRQPDRIQVRLDADDGMTRLCAVEAALASRWPPSTVKELIWLTRTERTDGDRLHLRLGKDQRIKEIALEMLRVELIPPVDGETSNHYRLARKL